MATPTDASRETSTDASPRQGWWSRLTRSRTEDEAAELQEQMRVDADPRVRPIDCCTPGEPVVVRGIVRSVTLRPASTAPAVEIELDDGTGSISVVWLGRRRIPGVDAGRSMVVCGRMTCNTEHPTIYNPRYELKPSTA